MSDQITLCGCGCGLALPERRHSTRKYLNEQHARLARNKRGYVDYPPVECICGCGETFKPTSIINKFINDQHRERYHAEKLKRKPKVVSSYNNNKYASFFSEDAKERNRMIIDRMEGRVLAGDLRPIWVIPGASGKVTFAKEMMTEVMMTEVMTTEVVTTDE